MEKKHEYYGQFDIFSGLSPHMMGDMLLCLNARQISCGRDYPVLMAGDPAGTAGIVISGKVRIITEDYYGNRSITSQVEAGEMFAEVFACSDISIMPVSVFSAGDSEILLIDLKNLRTCKSEGADLVLSNLLRIISAKTILLNSKISILSKRSTREKLLSYLSAQAKQAGSSRFTIPFNRQELADFLCVDRSAMSAELGRMARDGLICYKKEKFELL